MRICKIYMPKLIAISKFFVLSDSSQPTQCPLRVTQVNLSADLIVPLSGNAKWSTLS